MLRILLAWSVCLFVAGQSLAAEPSWKAGAAAIKVTPEGPMWMAGYAGRNKPSEGVAQDLFAKSLALEDAEGRRFVIVTLDLISVPGPLRKWVEEQAKVKYGLDPQSLLMNCSHTHCGPEIRVTSATLEELDAERRATSFKYVESLKANIVTVIGQALNQLAPSKLNYLRARAGFAMNRRTPNPTGYSNHPNPDGPVDHDVPVLSVADSEGKLKAVLFGYACHNTTIGFYQLCGDYAGYAQEYFEADHPGVVALFALGCGGDQNPYPRGTIELARLHGRTLATAIEAALQTRPRPITGRLRSALEYSELSYATPPTQAELETRVNSKDVWEQRYAERLLKQLKEQGRLLERYPAPVQVAQIGNEVTLISLPGETVVDYSLRLKRELGQVLPSAVWVTGYSNDVFAYIPSRRVLEEGGYEAGGAMRYMTTVIQPGPFSPDVEERLIAKVHSLIDRLR